MNRSSLAVALSLVLATAACSVTAVEQPPVASDASAPVEPTVTPAGDAAAPAKLDFEPSNFDLAGIDITQLGDVVVDESCTVDASNPTACFGQKAKSKVVDQKGAGRLTVVFARNIRVEPNVTIKVGAPSAIAIVAIDTFDIRGTIDASARSGFPTAGGYAGDHTGSSPLDGHGPGGGKAGTRTSGSGGGAYCGAGGAGGIQSGDIAAAGGKSYGSDTLIPLVGGSSGGYGGLGAGSGGGAVQLVAGIKLIVAADATIAAGGGGGYASGVVNTQPGGGGGSGGAILIESKSVDVLGTIAVNGGAGGGNIGNLGEDRSGENGKPNETPATSPYTSEGTAGGEGSAGETTKGGDGVGAPTRIGTGGGGGAGRIRINADKAQISGMLSPRIGPCAVEGKLIRK